MNAPMMNKMQLCGAGSTGPEVIAQRAESLQASRRPGVISPFSARKAAAVALGAAVLAVGAAAWLVASRAAPLQFVELPRVVIQAQRLPPGTCPVPVQPAGADCPVPLQAKPADATDSSLARSTQP